MRALLTVFIVLICTLAQAGEADVIHTIKQAIQGRRQLAITYEGQERIVEPHMLAMNQADRLALSAWFLSGYSKSGGGPGWRQYIVSKILSARMLEASFPGPRPGYKPDGGRLFHNILVGL